MRDQDLAKPRLPQEGDAHASLSHAEKLLTVAGALGVILYPLGFVQLVLRLSLAYTHDFTSAWYAASLVPLTVVVGQGVRLLGERPSFVLGLLLNLLLVLLVPRWIDRRRASQARRREAEAEEDRRDKDELERSLALAERILEESKEAHYEDARRLAERVASIAWGKYHRVSRQLFWLQVRFLLIRAAHWASLLIAVSVLLLVALGIGLQAAQGQWLTLLGQIVALLAAFAGTALAQGDRWEMSRWARVVLVALIFYVGLTADALAAGHLNQPRLPVVEIAPDGGAPIKGRLLAHADRYWYVFVEATGELLSVPESRAGTPRIISK